MRILMISDVYFPRINGVSTSIRNFRKELAELGDEVTLIAPEYGPDDEADESLFRVPSRFIPVDPEDRMMKRRHILELLPELERTPFDLVHIQTPFVAHYAGITLARRLRVPRVVSYHTHFEEYLHHYLPLVPKALTRFAARSFNRSQCNDVDAIIVPSRAMLEVLRGYGIDRPIEVIPTGVDEHFFRPGDGGRFCAEHNIDRQRPVLVHVGRLAHEKNIDFLLHMLVRLRRTVPDVLLIIAGEGPAETHLRNLVKTLRLGGNVQFVGYLDRNSTLLDCYSAGAAFIFSSRTETQGLVLLEAMAQGTPVVALSALGTYDILNARRGAIVSGDDREEFADKVALLLGDAKLRLRLKEEAREYARTWSSRQFAARKQAFYRETIRSCASPGTARAMPDSSGAGA